MQCSVWQSSQVEAEPAVETVEASLVSYRYTNSHNTSVGKDTVGSFVSDYEVACSSACVALLA